MTAINCTVAEIAAELRSRFALRPREAWRHAHGWTLQETADQLNEAGGGCGDAVAADASLVGKWERWPLPSGRRPTLPTLVALAAAFDCGIEQLVDLEDRRAMPEADRLVLSQTAPRPAALPAEPPMASNNEPIGAELIHLAATESADWASWAEATNVGAIGIEQLMADARGLSQDYLTGDPTYVFMQTRKLRDRTFAILEGRQYPRQTADLYLVAGYLCTLLAWMSSDLGQLRDAETHGRAAWLCAELAEDRELQAWVLSTRSKVAFWDGRLRDAINHARRGADLRATGTVGILLACQAADAWSQLGVRQEALEALAVASEARDALRTTDELGGLFSCPELRRANYGSAVRLRIGDAAGALREAEDALTTQPVHSYGTAAQMHISRAFAHLALGTPEGAAEALRPVLALRPEHRLEPVVRRLQEFSSAVARSRSAEGTTAITLRGEMEAWCSDSAPQYLALSPGQGAT
ncbi:helix-turn-helix domain-containing protein [Streptomyces roseifaciens]